MRNKILILIPIVLLVLALVGCDSTTPPVDENQAPMITSTPGIIATVGVEYIYDVKATDPDGDSLTYILDEWPDGMKIDNITGSISWIPKCNQVGAHFVVVGVLDGDLEDTQSFIITVKKAYVPPVSKLYKIEISQDFWGITFSIKNITYQLEVIAHYDDGTTADVTLKCDYTSSNPDVAIVDDEGLITAIETGDIDILASYTQYNSPNGNITRTAEVEVTVSP
jgi:hypothetical protein